jgi:CheY-like chemotaxis protein
MFTPHRFRYFVICQTIFRVRATTLLSEMPSRILIADDSALLRSALRGLFNGIGDYEILEAESGTEAVAKTNECRPNLIILDFAMPGMDGLKVARVLQNSLPEIPIVMYTMHYTDQLSAAALAAGAKQVISKSETGSLISTVRELLTRSEDAPKPAPAPAINSNAKELVFDTPITRTGT